MKALFTIHAFVSWAFGLAFLLVPIALLKAYGITLNPGSTIVVRLLGGAFVGLGLMAWLSSHVAPAEGLRAIILGITVTAALGCLVSLHGVMSGGSNALGWVSVVLYGFFAVGFGTLATGKAPVTATADRPDEADPLGRRRFASRLLTSPLRRRDAREHHANRGTARGLGLESLAEPVQHDRDSFEG
ncbi:MAG TPA: hypothetical protein VMK42_04950 [Anaeromyxobacteraceae bacterium]|nr:hypothetical protein [Anaeromyxobacteraceae bacterium]